MRICFLHQLFFASSGTCRFTVICVFTVYILYTISSHFITKDAYCNIRYVKKQLAIIWARRCALLCPVYGMAALWQTRLDYWHDLLAIWRVLCFALLLDQDKANRP